MSDMEVVIKISEEKYNKLVMEEEHIRACGSYYPVMILDGIPLNKGHGRLIDANELCEGRVSNDIVVIAVKCAPTIIEADKESEDKE